MANKLILLITTAALCGLTIGCSSGNGTSTGNPDTATQDTSASAVVAEVVGGALGASSSTGTLTLNDAIHAKQDPVFSLWRELSVIPQAMASVVCPSFKSAQNAGCDAGGSSLWIMLSNCVRGSGTTEWNGTEAMTMSSGAAACQSFPNPGASGALYTQIVQGDRSTSPGTITLTSPEGFHFYLDDETANLGNFNGDTIPYVEGTGYGRKVTFDASGNRSSLTVADHQWNVGSYNHSIVGTVNLSESGSQQTITGGTITFYHNSEKIIGTSTFTSVVHDDSCCVPISVEITTTFSAGNFTPVGQGTKMVGKSETLTFTGSCGSATLLNTDGTTQSVTLTRCY